MAQESQRALRAGVDKGASVAARLKTGAGNQRLKTGQGLQLAVGS